MTNQEQIQALIEYYQKEEEDCHRAQSHLYPPCPTVKRQALENNKKHSALSAMLDENKRFRDLLETAKIGLEWYRAEHPDDASEADKELMIQIEQAL